MTGEAARPRNVLFLCTGNSARSILAEALLNHWGRGRFRAWSAGSFPAGRVNPWALELLARMKIESAGARSKGWDEFARPGAPALDFVITVCDKAAGEVCPVWPGQPVTAHWGVPDPAVVTGNDAQIVQAFRDAFRVLEHRIRIFVELPLASLDSLKVRRELDRIGALSPPADDAPARR
jgi:arsenate reductase